ncbi:nitrite/sulfite reductase [Granulosicoccus antarcticus]|uniref:Sulfite reductase (Ferredoxin) n=1 Tax=Granulosicoccus antarcticus IMCC3135 TaxID=1192854 RepID=A0A2Z2NLS8_9GAMM|nr:nitrite/sulfite reductase [Granulosicoccus antarcticus]ASJ72392.1 Sulfite reductase (ferredoxin) [Granulosicoccus antarcticus IMCC3135]
MYQYTEYDRDFLQARVAEFRDQTERRLSGALGEDEYKQLRLRNGLYEQRHAYMLRVAIPYGMLSSVQMKTLGHIAREYDKGYGHITTRQNIQYNWPELAQVPDILQELADVDMHAIQTSGNCIRNTTTDPLAGAVGDELEDPRPWCELIRQWSTLHPEFNWLPRKFKIAVTGALSDRAAVQVHDIGLRLVKNEAGETGFEVLVGGGLGRTPYIGQVICEFLPTEHLLTYISAILRVYNLEGRRDNLYKARIKILVNALGIDVFREKVEQQWAQSRNVDDTFTTEQIEALKAQFPAAPLLGTLNVTDEQGAGNSEQPDQMFSNPLFNQWYQTNTKAHRDSGRRIVYLSLKSSDQPAGDITADQMEKVAELAEQFSLGEIRSTHEQNLVLAHVPVNSLFELWTELKQIKLATPNLGKLTDMIVCPGLDYCSLANAGTLEIHDQIYQRFDNLDYLHELGDISIKISGCMNACGHHHVGDIGILGVDKGGVEWYQLTIGGHAGNKAYLGLRLGKAIAKSEVANAIEQLLEAYVACRQPEESFHDVVMRLGTTPFKERVYATAA